jgi:hypothetical protein
MGRQQALPLDGVPSQNAPWWRVPEVDQKKLVEILARLLACAVHGKTGKEDSNDNGND